MNKSLEKFFCNEAVFTQIFNWLSNDSEIFENRGASPPKSPNQWRRQDVWGDAWATKGYHAALGVRGR